MPKPGEPTVPLADRLTYTISQAAQISGLTERQLRAAIQRGDLATFTLPDSTLRHVTRRALILWVEGLC